MSVYGNELALVPRQVLALGEYPHCSSIVYSFNSHTMKATGFQLVEVTNPTTGDVTKKLRVKFDTCVAINLLMPRDTTLEALMVDIKANRDAYLAKVQVREGEFGQYCVFSLAKIEDEF